MKKSFGWQGLEALSKERKEEQGAARDYRRCRWSRRQCLMEAVKCAGVVILFAWFFYRSPWAAIPMSVIGILLWKKDERRYRQEERRKLILQFRDCIRCADTAMRAGYSVENAFLSAIPDMRLMHGEDSCICRELERIRRGLVINMTVEALFYDFGERSGAAPVREFAEILGIAKRSGGSIPKMIRISAEIIHQKVEAEEEIYTQTAARRMEQGIMSVMPFAIAVYLESGNPGYFDVLFHNLQGICIMSGCLAVYLGGVLLADKILEQTSAVWE